MGDTTQGRVRPEIEKFWTGAVSDKDDFGDTIIDEFIDGRTKDGPWAIMTTTSWAAHGVGRLGEGYGQRYELFSDGKWRKMEG